MNNVTDSKPTFRRPALVLFHATWCGYCRVFVPTFKKVATALKGSGIEVVMADIDKAPRLASSYGVSSYPTVMYVPAGRRKPVVFQGERELDSILKFVSVTARNTQ
jgi:protein disulfide-isomerase A6